MTLDELIEHIAAKMPPTTEWWVTFDHNNTSNAWEPPVEYRFTWWSDSTTVGKQLTAKTEAVLRELFDAWFAEQNFDNPFEGVEMQLVELED